MAKQRTKRSATVAGLRPDSMESSGSDWALTASGSHPSSLTRFHGVGAPVAPTTVAHELPQGTRRDAPSGTTPSAIGSRGQTNERGEKPPASLPLRGGQPLEEERDWPLDCSTLVVECELTNNKHICQSLEGSHSRNCTLELVAFGSGLSRQA